MIFKKDMLIGTAMGFIVGCSGAIFAQAPVVNIGERHGNLRAAQQYMFQPGRNRHRSGGQ